MIYIHIEYIMRYIEYIICIPIGRALLIHIDHLKELLQVGLVDVHDSKAALERGVSARPLNELLEGHQAAAVRIDPIKDALQELVVLLLRQRTTRTALKSIKYFKNRFLKRLKKVF